MSDAPVTPDPAETTPVVTQEVTPPVDTDLPDWAKQKISELNAEAAKHRVEKNAALATAKAQVEAEFKEQLTQAATEIQNLKDLLSVSNIEKLKLEAAVDAKVPSESAKDFASILQGTTPEEIKSHAEAAKKLFGNVEGKDRPVDPTQGTGSPLPLNGDPLLEAVRRAIR